MDKKTIQQMLEIDKQAQTIHENALKEAAQLLAQAEKEAPDFIEKARQQAEQEAKEILARSQSSTIPIASSRMCRKHPHDGNPGANQLRQGGRLCFSPRCGQRVGLWAAAFTIWHTFTLACEP